MFGYLPAPCRCQIGNQADLYRSTFCGLCNALAGQYGQPARLLINRDSTFVALLAAAQSPVAPTVTLSTRCQPWSRPIPVFESGSVPAFAAAVTLCGLQAKLGDEQADERGLRAGGCRVLSGVVAQTFRPRSVRSGRLRFPRGGHSTTARRAIPRRETRGQRRRSGRGCTADFTRLRIDPGAHGAAGRKQLERRTAGRGRPQPRQADLYPRCLSRSARRSQPGAFQLPRRAKGVTRSEWRRVHSQASA